MKDTSDERFSAAARNRIAARKRSQRIVKRLEMTGDTVDDLMKACDAIEHAVNVVGNVNMFPHASFAKATLADIFDLSIKDLDRARFRLGRLAADLRSLKPAKPRRVKMKDGRFGQ